MNEPHHGHNPHSPPPTGPVPGERESHDPHAGHASGGSTGAPSEPAKPGYPEHPEQRSPAAAGPVVRNAHDGHAAHAARDDHGDHGKHAGHSVEAFRRKFWIALALTIPTLIWGEMIPEALGFTPPAIPFQRWIPVVFGTIVFFYGGWVFLQGAARELAGRKPGMMTLISLAISVAFLFSAAVTLGLIAGMTLWWELASLVTIMLLGHWMEMRSVTQAQGALKELAKLLPGTATRVVGDQLEEVELSALREGDLLLVRPGASVPADGAVQEGRSSVNESMVTGESVPVTKEPGAEVIAGTVNGEGSLRVRVTRTGEKTALAGIMRLVAQAQTSRSRAQVVADRAAFFLTIVAIASAAVTGIVWALLDAPAAFTIERVVTVLVIACPHALGLAVPLVVAISTTIGARNGLLVRDRRGLEEARNLTAVVFDKTGTLTMGEHRVVAMRTAGGLAEDEALRLAAAVERDAEHPVARAIVKSAEERGIRPPAASDFRAIPGHGVQATVEGRTLFEGGPNLLLRLNVEPPPELRAFAQEAAVKGQGVIYLVEGRRALATFAVADAVRPESREAIRRLHERGIEVAMLTGDSRPVAEAVARDLGIDTVFAQVLPEQKVERIREIQARGRKVAMVGDGINDAAALASSDVGIAIGTGTDVAVEAGDIVLVRSDPRDVPRIITLSAATYRKMVQNLWAAAGYNVIAIPLAAGVLQPWGIVLSPAIGAVLMSLSTIVVAANAQLLRRARL
jgi:Cu2+-exporting ATPase